MPKNFEEPKSPENAEPKIFLCDDCDREAKKNGGFFVVNIIGTCEKCGGYTSSRTLKICRKCAKEIKICQNCVKPLDQSDENGH